MHFEFLLRKIKVMPGQSLGQSQIDEIDGLSIGDIFVKVNLFPDPPKTVMAEGEATLPFKDFDLRLIFA